LKEKLIQNVNKLGGLESIGFIFTKIKTSRTTQLYVAPNTSQNLHVKNAP
jgi:hypothetical protein